MSDLTLLANWLPTLGEPLVEEGLATCPRVCASPTLARDFSQRLSLHPLGGGGAFKVLVLEKQRPPIRGPADLQFPANPFLDSPTVMGFQCDIVQFKPFGSELAAIDFSEASSKDDS